MRRWSGSYTSKWEGNVLVTTMTTAASAAIASVEKRWIQADGTMKVETLQTFISEPRSETSVKVYKKTK